MPKEKIPHKCLSIILLDSVIKTDYNKYYPQTFLEECVYKQQKQKNYITEEELKSDSDSINESESESKSDSNDDESKSKTLKISEKACIGHFVICLKSEILIIETWNEYIKKSDGMVNLFFKMLGCLLFKKSKKFNESCWLSKAVRMSSTYLK